MLKFFQFIKYLVMDTSETMLETTMIGSMTTIIRKELFSRSLLNITNYNVILKIFLIVLLPPISGQVVEDMFSDLNKSLSKTLFELMTNDQDKLI